MIKIKFLVLLAALVIALGGMLQMSSKVSYARANCPTGTNCGCSHVFAPVLCGKQKCRYTNFCYARCAGWTSTQCTDVP